MHIICNVYNMYWGVTPFFQSVTTKRSNKKLLKSNKKEVKIK